MQTYNYYLMYLDDSYLFSFVPGYDLGFKDITAIDLETISYTKDEFVKMIKENSNIDLTQKNIYVVRSKYNKIKGTYENKFYNGLFKPSKDFNPNFIIYLQNIMQERLAKVENHEKDIRINRSSKFKRFIDEVTSDILCNEDVKNYVTRYNSVVDSKVKEHLLKMYGSDYNFWLDRAIHILESYMKLRGFIVEYLSSFNLDMNRLNLHGEEKYFMPEKISDDNPFIFDEEEKARYLSRGYNKPYDNEEVGELVKKYGSEKVLESYDMDSIYDLSLDDLLKLKVISEDYYLERKQTLKRKK